MTTTDVSALQLLDVDANATPYEICWPFTCFLSYDLP
jgi:hypothetical protein